MENLSLKDDDEWHQKEGVPRLEDQFIQQYLSGRDALVEQEKKQRSDRFFRENMSPMASEACAIVDQIRFEERQILWTKDYEDSLTKKSDVDIYPGMMFSQAKERMETSKLWKIVRKMPKGCLLHCHFEAMVGIEFMLQAAFTLGNIAIQAQKSLDTADSLLTTPFTFTHPKTAPPNSSSIWSADYIPNTPVPLNEAADSYPSGNRMGFIAWAKSRCAITPEESVAHHQGPNEIWRKFISTFAINASIIYIEPIFKAYIRQLCRQLHEDNILWADVRAEFFDPTNEHPKKRYAELFQIFVDEVQAYKTSEEGKGFWGLRIIWTCLRSYDKKTIIEAMKQCITLKKAFPTLLAGFDFVGQEDSGRPLQDLVPEIFWFRKCCAEEGVNIPFFFHAGETLGDGDETDENLFDAILLGTRRIGHGFSLFKHPLLVDMIKDKKILVESCPVSNEVLRLTSSILSHPLPALLARGVSVALCNDDPAILGPEVSGVSHDFWQALQGWENLGLAGLGSLAENSVRWAAFEDEDNKAWVQGIKDGAFGKGARANRLKEWMGSWERFCSWVVTEFGSDEDFSRED
ncbi:Metallo-dependent hydrolase [Tothia fuscella]|uniref:adenosine deaminase n=1 Tax=Tothia fuscella TaxID=1048955 RepID=A0A9P4TXP7_9PEZI|nr:Metallo-dependent hydrolase [Tothia fuscella]